MEKVILDKKTGRPRRGVYLKCEKCKKEFYVNPARLRQTQRLCFNIRFCSMKCYDHSGYNNPFWGKKKTKESIEKTLSHPNYRHFSTGKDNPNFVRFVEDKYIGSSHAWWKKYLFKNVKICEICSWNGHTEVLEIHHKDKDNKNNVRENLLLLCPNCHSWEHYKDKSGKFHWNK